MVCKIFVAEDEPPILRDMIHKIESFGPAFRVVGHASDGEEALEGIRILRPDVLLTDIHMPMRSGLSLIEEAKSELPELVCLITSGYKDFEFARQALKLGVDDYLVKPIMTEALARAMGAAKSKVDERHNRNMIALLNAFSRRGFAVSGYDADNLRLRLLYIVVNHPFRKLPANPRTRELMAEAWSEEGLGGTLKGLRELEYEPIWVVDGIFDNEKIVVLEDSEDGSLRVNDIWQKLSFDASNRSWYATGATSQIDMEVEVMSTEIDRLRMIAWESAVIGKSGLFEVPKEDIYSRWTSGDEKMIAMLSQNGQKAQLQEAIDRLLEFWIEENLPNSSLESRLVGVLTLVGLNANHIEYSQGRNAERFVEDLFSDCRDADCLRRTFAEAIENAMIANPETARTDYEEVVNLVCGYIESNYPNKLTLRELAQQFGLSESHLSKLFKKYKDESPIDYLLKVRIEKSKRLIEENPSFMFKDIAELVGFTDQYYYSRVFRNHTGCTPSEYRSRISK